MMPFTSDRPCGQSILRGFASIPAVVITLVVAGCADALPSGPNGGDPTATATTRLSLSLALGGATASGAASGSDQPSFDVEQSDGSNELRLTRVALVLRDIELERQFDDCPDHADDDRDDDACEEFEAGPILLELPLDGAVEQIVTIDVPPGIYDEIEFEVHKADDDDPEDLQFIQSNPAFEDVSIRVEGTFNGADFVFLQDLNEDQETELSPPLVVEEGSGPTNLTMTLDVTTWFVRADGSLVDPRSANKGGPNENLVRDNIKDSIEGAEAFEDEDRDGRR